MVYIYYVIITIICSLLCIFISKTPVIETFLLYTLIICVGVSGIMGFIMHTFKADRTAKYIGWEPGSPFQFEVAVANLATGICGILCIWFSGGFWFATIVAFSIFLWGAAFGHIVEIKKKKNYAPGNSGVVLYWGIFLPFILIGLYIANHYVK